MGGSILSELYLQDNDRTWLLSLARNKLESCVRGIPMHVDEIPKGRITEHGAAFATLHKGGRLRGCIGTMIPKKPLWTTVSEMVERAAFHDPRFSAVKADELDEIHIELSVLTPMVSMTTIGDVQVGRHGLMVESGYCRGVLLPQVASERGWSAQEFLEKTCEKAGLSPEAHGNSDFRAWVFEAEVFGENEP